MKLTSFFDTLPQEILGLFFEMLFDPNKPSTSSSNQWMRTTKTVYYVVIQSYFEYRLNSTFSESYIREESMRTRIHNKISSRYYQLGLAFNRNFLNTFYLRMPVFSEILANIHRIELYSCPELTIIPCPIKAHTLKIYQCTNLLTVSKLEVERLEVYGNDVIESLDMFANIPTLIISQFTKLKLINGIGENDKLLSLTLHYCPELIDIGNITSTNIRMLKISSCDKIVDLNLSFLSMKEIERKLLLNSSRSKGITELFFQSCYKLKNYCFLQNLESLKKLTLSSIDLTNDNLRDCFGGSSPSGNLSSTLYYLDISRNFRITDLSWFRGTAIRILNISYCQNLESIQELVDPSIPSQPSSKLIELIMINLPRVNSISCLANIPSLRILNVSNCVSIISVKSLTSVKKMIAIGSRNIRDIPELKKLNPRVQIVTG